MTIQRHYRPSIEQFKILRQARRPFIIWGLDPNIPALGWTLEYLEKQWGPVAVQVMLGRDDAPKTYEQVKAPHLQTIPLGEFIQRVRAAGHSNDLYMVANNEVMNSGPLSALPPTMGLPVGYSIPAQSVGSTFLWIGPAGTLTPLHYDACDLCMLQIEGRKRWLLWAPEYTPLLYNSRGVYSDVDVFNPDLGMHPLFDGVPYTEAVLSPGELLYMPQGYWHAVESLDTSVGISFTNLPAC